MTITNRLGRPMLAAMFVSGGADQLLHPDEKTDIAETVVDEIDERVEGVPLPQQPRDAVRLNGAVQLVAGGLLAIDRVPRLASTALAASLIPTTLGAHRFWEIDDEDARAQQRVHFFKNVAMLGGLVITMGDTGRNPSVGWRANRAMRRARTDIADTAGDIGLAAAATVATAADSVADAASSATDALPTASAAGPQFSAPDLSRVSDDARDLAKGLRDAAEPAGTAVRARARDLASRARAVDIGTRRKGAAAQARAVADRGRDLARDLGRKLPDVSGVKQALPGR